MQTLQGLSGLICLLLIALACSEARTAIRPRLLLTGLLCQLGLAILLLKLPGSEHLFLPLTWLVNALQQATAAGSAFVFGYLGGGAAPFNTRNPGNGFVLAFQALPLILVMSALSALLFHWKILPLLVNGFAWILGKTFGISGALGFCCAANVFVGMTEAPLLIRPWLTNMTRSELFAVMVTGMATIAGTVMVLYATFLGPVVPDALRHLLSASLISAPAALVIAHIMVPDHRINDQSAPPITTPLTDQGAMDAITRGTLDGLQLWLNVIAMLLVLVALVALLNMGLGWLPSINGEPLSLQQLLGWIMAPVVWLTGIPWQEAPAAGALMGVKTVLNELVAYLQLAALTDHDISERSRIIMTYNLCGFANFASLGILIGGLGAMAPERRPEIVELGMRSLLAGTLATLMTGAMVGLLI